MLVELRIKNFAIIDDLSIGLGPGLNVFTGETGAGKSIIIDALTLVLGDRATTDVIRSSEDEARVEALFDVSGQEWLQEVLEEGGIDYSDTLVIKRVVQRAGRNKIYVNGSLATLVTLTEVGSRLIDIYGQSEHQSLTRPEEHLEILDTFGGLTGLRAEMASSCGEYISIKKELDGLLRDGSGSKERKDLLEYQSREIGEACLRPGEDGELAALKERLKNAERIKSAASLAEGALYSDEGSVTERLGAAVKELKEVSAFDERLKGVVEGLEASLYQVEDASGFLRDYTGSIEYEAGELDRIEERIELIKGLKRKYGATIEEVLEKKEAVESELSGLAGIEGRIAGLEAALEKARTKALEAAGRLTQARSSAAEGLKGRIEEELSTLGMKGSVFEVVLSGEKDAEGTARFSEKGSDRVRFYISPNPGEEVKPLARIASGGELSRTMLALKRATAAGRVPTLVFDEIDSGVGGAMGQVVGLKLKEVARSNQVLCITHLPQIAAFADNHYAVRKETVGARTTTSVRALEGEERTEELSWMLGGSKATETTRKHARELVDSARAAAENLPGGPVPGPGAASRNGRRLGKKGRSR